jgi:hypothetical protein
MADGSGRYETEVDVIMREKVSELKKIGFEALGRHACVVRCHRITFMFIPTT